MSDSSRMLRRLRMSRSAVLTLVGLLGLLAGGCQPGIGDSCGSSTDCSATGERQCDLAQPGGYCTIVGCNADLCPGSAICVEWRFIPSRTAETWCMKPCSSDGDCRSAYLCALPSQITREGTRAPAPLPEEERVARTIDLAEDKASAMICAALIDMPASPFGDGGVEPDTDAQ